MNCSAEDWITLCRICLQENNQQMYSLSEVDSKNSTFKHRIWECINISITDNNIWPQKICTNCKNDIRKAERLKQNCQRSEHILQTLFENSLKTDEQDLCNIIEGEKSLREYSPVIDETENNFPKIKDDYWQNDSDFNVSETDLDLQTTPKIKLEDNKLTKIKLEKTKQKRNATGISQYFCEICGNSYIGSQRFLDHMRRHRSEKPFECEVCGKGFVTKGQLRNHMVKHTGARPYGCRYCDKKFSDSSSRIKHERSHTGERPYKCEYCSKTFAVSYILKNHIKTHTGERNFICSICTKGFVKKSDLKTHMKSHKGYFQQQI